MADGANENGPKPNVPQTFIQVIKHAPGNYQVLWGGTEPDFISLLGMLKHAEGSVLKAKEDAEKPLIVPPGIPR